MRNPTGDIPWEEDPNAGDVVHVDNKQVTLRQCICTFSFEMCPIFNLIALCFFHIFHHLEKK